MKIPLHSDWELKISGKAKVYPLSTRDQDLVDKTFNKLHQQGQLSWT